ncbi:hypothetical protein SDC9_135607 [bioreactor metagenome]|uniref:Uncharacterized protein n=1 Tax=bioreactor metagenome TaxID=1076179 RepID=A0A645DI58_9ZZZZ
MRQHESDTRQYDVNAVQQRRTKHEGKFQRFGNPGDESGKCGGEHQTRHFFAILWTRGVIDSKRSTRQAKHKVCKAPCHKTRHADVILSNGGIGQLRKEDFLRSLDQMPVDHCFTAHAG